MAGLPLPEVAADLGSGAGCELDGKLCAAHSSAALVVNAFGMWRNKPEAFSIAGLSGFRSMRFEATCPTGLGGTPPHLDVLADGDVVAAVESKCTEWMDPKPACFSPSYDRLRVSHGHSPWYELIGQLRAEPGRYKFVDAAQLVKHALGLLTCYGAREVRLIYLYWEPRNAADWPECAGHRAEADELASLVARCSVRLYPMSYRELWEEWTNQELPPHLAYLRARYDCVV